MTEGRGGLLKDAFGLTRRDVVVGSLRSLECIWEERHHSLESEPALLAWSELLRQVLENLIEDASTPDAPRLAPLYGVPTWTYQDGQDGSAAALVELENAFSEPPDDLPQAFVQVMLRLGEDLRAYNSTGEPPDEYLFRLRYALTKDVARIGEAIDALARPTSDRAWAGQQVRPVVLAARGIGSSLAEYHERYRSLEQAKAASDPTQSAWHLAHESLARMARLEIPICSADGRHSMLLTARITPTLQPHAVVRLPGNSIPAQYPALYKYDKNWSIADDSFVEGANAGLRAAQAFLRAIGHPQVFEGADIELFGILPPARVTGASAALPIALEIVRQELRLPPSGYAASGAMRERRTGPPSAADTTYAIEPLLANVDAAKVRAVLEDGYRRGLVRAVVEPGQPVDAGILPPGATLTDAARAMWGEGFETALQFARNEWVKREGFLPGWQSEPPQPFIQTRQADQLHEAFSAPHSHLGANPRKSAPPQVAFLGGPARSGKTNIVRDLAMRLCREGHWDVAVLTARSHERVTAVFTSPGRLLALVKQERAVLRPDRRHLLIFDGVEYDDRLDDLEEMLRGAADESVSFLVVRRSDRTTNWRSSEGESFDAIYGQGALAEFCDRLLEQDLSAAAREAALRQAALQNDLRWLVDVANGLDPSRALASLVGAAIENDRARLRHLAYASFYEIAIPDAFLARLSQELRTALASHCMIGQDGHWIISSRAVATTIIATLDIGRSTSQARGMPDPTLAPRILLNIFSVLLGSGHELAVPAELDLDGALELCWLLQRRWKFLASQVIPTCAPALWRAVKSKEDLRFYIALLRSADSFLPNEELTRALHEIATTATRLVEENRIGAADLRACLESFDHNRGVFDSEQAELDGAFALELALAALRRALGSTVRRSVGRDQRVELNRLADIFRQEASRKERLLLATVVLSEYSIEWDAILAASFDALLDLPETGEDFDFGYLLGCLDMSRRLARALHELNQPRSHTLEHGSDRYARELIERIPLERHGRGLLALCLLERLRIRVGLIDDDWAIEHRNFHGQLVPLLKDAEMVEIVRGMGELHDENSSFLVRYINTLRPFSNNFIVNPRRTASQVADFLGAISRWHGETAFGLLYNRSSLEQPVPHQGTAEHLARLVSHRADGRNAGRLVSAAIRIDDLYATRGAFSLLLMNRIGQEFYEEQFRSEVRSSLLYHQVEGLLRVGPPWLNSLEPLILEHVKKAIDGVLLPWTARLAMLIADDPEMGASFREDLREVIADRRPRILEGMTGQSSDPETLEAYHSLARLDDAEDGLHSLSVCFAECFRKPGVRRLMIERIGRRGRPALAARVLLVIRDCLRRAGADHLVKQLEDEAESSLFTRRDNQQSRGKSRNNGWRVRCIRKARAEDLAETLDHLRALNPTGAHGALLLRRVFSDDDHASDILTDKLLRLRQSAEDVARFLEAVEAIRPGAGVVLLGRYCRSPPRRRFLSRELQFTQNPRAQSMAARRLVSFGFPDLDALQTIYDVWRDRVRTLRSPASLVEMLSFHRALDDHAARSGASRHRETATRIDIQGLIRRLERPRTEDLRFLPALADNLARAGLVNEARQLVRIFFQRDVAAHLEPEGWAAALGAAAQVGEPVPSQAISRLDDAARQLAREINHHDDVALWLGLAAYAAARSRFGGGSSLRLDSLPATLAIPKNPAIRLLAVRWLEPAEWTDRCLGNALSEIAVAPEELPRDLHGKVVDALSGLRERSEAAEVIALLNEFVSPGSPGTSS